MRSKGRALSIVPNQSIGQSEKPVLVLDEVSWATSKVSLSDVLMGNDEPIQVNKVGEVVSGEVNLLKFKALNPQAISIEVSIVGNSNLPPLFKISNAA